VEISVPLIIMKIEYNNVLITGAAGFIGYHLAKRLLEDGCKVTGIDNLNSYYDVSLKKTRLEQLKPFRKFSFVQEDISNKESLEKILQKRTIRCGG